MHVSRSLSILKCLTLLCFFIVGLSSCKEDTESKIESESPEASHKSNQLLVDYVKTPLDKAQDIKKLAESRDKEMGDELEVESDPNDQ